MPPNIFRDVERFQTRVVGVTIPDMPTRMDEKPKAMAHLVEELNELTEASTIVDEADALIDLIYIAVGRLVRMGLGEAGFEVAWQEIQRANMERIRIAGDDHKQGVVKPHGWRGPDWDRVMAVATRFHRFADEKGTTRENWRAPMTAQNQDDDDWGGRHAHGKLFPTRPGGGVKEIDPDDFLAMDSLTRQGFTPKKMLTSKDPQWILPKVLIIGHGRHGKDTVAEHLRDEHGFSFTSSSLFCAETVMMPAFKTELHPKEGPIYETAQECYDDRHNYRDFWFDQIRKFNSPDAGKLARAIFEKHDLYCGIRSTAEFNAARNAELFQVSVWVDASKRLEPEPSSSMELQPWMADYIVDNNGTLEELRFNVETLYEHKIKPLVRSAFDV